ncbi:MAG: FtsB family cell division protein [Opitutaceae bacterium]
MNLRQIVFSVYLAIFAALGVAAGLYFVNMREEYTLLQRREAADQHRLDDAEKTLADQERTLDRLRNDPDYVARVIRRNLGYAKPDEAIFHFPN